MGTLEDIISPHRHTSRRGALRAAGLKLVPAGAALLLGACAHAPLSTASAPAPAAPSAKTSFDFVGWDSYLSGSDSSQFSSLDQINQSNVTQLKVAWTFPTGEGPPPRFNPIVVKDVMYLVPDGKSIVALNAATGQQIWRHQFEGRIGNRGINYWQSEDGSDRRLLFINDGILRAVSADTGESISSFGETGGVDLRTGLDGDTSKIRPLQTDNPGRIFENLIIVSLPAGAYDFASSPADIHAYDVRTGKLVWVFHTVPKIGEFGSDTWPEKDRDKFGGVHNWSESTVDKDLGIIYIPTGTARYDFYGGNRPGNNLFANSILALDARTGKRIWHYQVIHHDLWDLDIPAAPKLLTLHKDGKDVPVVVQPTKHGFLFVLDRRTGQPIWPIEERPVPASDVPGEKASPTQPFPTWPQPFIRDTFTEKDINPYVPKEDQDKLRELFRTSRYEGRFTPPSVRGTIQFPGHNGGANWGSSAVDPLHQRFFVVAKIIPTFDKLILDKRPEAQAAMPNGGGDVQPYKSPVNFMMQSNGLGAIAPPWSTITAYDMNDGHILWQVPDGDVPSLAKQGITGTGSHAPRGGPVATAGGLLFVATSSDRKLRARDAATGRVLWEFDLPAASEGVPAVYQSGGRQFVVIPVGGNGLFSDRQGLPDPGPNQYIAFALPEVGVQGEKQ